MNDDLIKREQLSALVDGEAAALHMQSVLSFAESDDGQQSWRMYHLIGDVLRSPELAHHSSHDILSGVRAHMAREPIRGIDLGMTAEAAQGLLQGELEQLVPAEAAAGQQRGNGAAVVSMPARQAANASVFRWKVAAGFASVAAVAAVGWGAMVAGGGFSGRQGSQLAAVTPNAAVVAAAPSSLQAPAAINSLMGTQVAEADADISLDAQAQSSSAVAVAGPYGQTVMLRDARLDELLAAHPQYSSAPNLQMPASFLRNASFATVTRH